MVRRPLSVSSPVFMAVVASFMLAPIAWGAGPVTECLRLTLERDPAAAPVRLGDQRLNAVKTMTGFYEGRGFEAAWLGQSRRAEAARGLVAAIQAARADGLRPTDYHQAWLQRELGRFERGGLDPCEAARLDLALSDAFLMLATHMLSGRVHPESLHAEWFARPREGQPVELLKRALEHGQVERTVTGLRPDAAGYRRMIAALSRYRSIERAGGWTDVPLARSEEDGAERVVAAIARLRVTGDLAEEGPEAPNDDALANGLKRFQRRHGLKPTGVLDSTTVRAMNVGASERIEQIVLNLERWRWLPQNLGERRVMVNIAGFDLEVFEGENRVFESLAIVGRTYRRTPVFSDEISYVVLSPYWHVPPSIARNDILPAVRRDPKYLAKKNFTVFEGWGADAKVVDPATVDWKKVTGASLPYRFRQEPGSGNALGPVKIMFPNRFNVYLHGTPAQELFAEDVRAFSSGCIRLAKPLELTSYLLAGDPSWNRKRMEEAVARGSESTVKLPSRVPVHLLYWTAWVEPNDEVHFRRDIYDRDPALAGALAEAPPGGTP